MVSMKLLSVLSVRSDVRLIDRLRFGKHFLEEVAWFLLVFEEIKLCIKLIIIV